jgi:ABC-type Fe3+/spermidine/putrescine transport system ATPase subunit
MVFQDYALFPHLTVAENIAFGLVERRVPKAGIAPRVAELLELIQLPGLGGRTPAQLSGGQQQRVALARAIAHPPRVLLLDEPLGALDLKMREHMQVEVRRIQQQLGLTAVYVTHDQTEAMTMSDRIAVMNGGRIEQIGSPEAIYATPRTRFVASFIGKVNFLRGRVLGHLGGEITVQTAAGEFRCVPGDSGDAPVPQQATVAIRPEHLTILPAGQTSDEANRVEATIVSSTFCGSIRQYTATIAGGVELLVETRAGDPIWAPGSSVQIRWQARHAVLVADPHPQDPEGGPP